MDDDCSVSQLRQNAEMPFGIRFLINDMLIFRKLRDDSEDIRLQFIPSLTSVSFQQSSDPRS